jgi:hypothetical protein
MRHPNDLGSVKFPSKPSHHLNGFFIFLVDHGARSKISWAEDQVGCPGGICCAIKSEPTLPA